MTQLSSLKELLLRKTDKSELKNLIKNLNPNELQEYIEEVLEKMSQASRPNPSLRHFISEARDEKEATGGEPMGVAMIRDAMGHHAAAYSTALKEGNKDLANHHAKKFLEYGHLATKIHQSPAEDVLNFEAPSPSNWQHGVKNFADKSKPTGYNPPGWQAHYKGSNKHDLSWLQQAPHPDRAKNVFMSSHGEDEEGNPQYHNGAYPMEHAKINGKHITLHEGAKGDHPMDNHPIMKHGNEKRPLFSEYNSEHGEDDAPKYIEDVNNFMSSPHFAHMESLLDRATDPESGKTPGKPVHSNLSVKPLQNPKDYDASKHLDALLEQELSGGNDSVGSDLDKLLEEHAPKTPTEKKPIEAQKPRTKKDIQNDIANLDAEHPEFNNHLDKLLSEMKGMR